jgi:hypothetical protein
MEEDLIESGLYVALRVANAFMRWLPGVSDDLA